jgi:hypothetical protein
MVDPALDQFALVEKYHILEVEWEGRSVEVPWLLVE